MAQHKTDMERKRITAIAREYAEKGYDVNVSPNRDELPDFLQNYRPDIIATSYNENVVVEVKSGRNLVKSPYLPKLAKAIEENEGWRFEMVITNPRGKKEPIDDDIDVLTREDIIKRLEEIKHLLEIGQIEAAILLGWSAIEGTLRLMAMRERIKIKRRTASYLAKKMYNLGLITPDEYNILNEALELRNAVIHGYKTEKADSAVVEDMLTIIRELLGSI
ncbi:MAG TPA: hypothetical protein ENO22_02710 [candidate division Zixibacteria bacterium]|nr:hypothetical protein [candidate division Zixibacteria bacterium]HEQ98232.1 hypothetical protein [candidate division Zixibacteria bacterium]